MTSRSADNPIPAKWIGLMADHLPGYDPMVGSDGYWFDAELAEQCCGFFPAMLTHVEGELAGKPFTLEPWQEAIVGCVWGWKDRKTNLRRYREIFQFVPRGNGKTTMIGGLVNLVGLCGGEPGAQIYSAAAEREQAALVFRHAKGMCLANPEISDRVRPYLAYKSIDYGNDTFYKALSADAKTKHGANIQFVVVDELHCLADSELVDTLITGTGKRREPIVWYITTADFERPGSPCNAQYDYAVKVRDGVIRDDHYLPVIYEADKADAWDDPETWKKANPNYGVSVYPDYLKRQCLKAQESVEYENTFKRLHLNIRTEQAVRYIKLDKWDLCGQIPVSPEDLEGRVCYGGLDLASNNDLAALCLVFPPFEDEHYRVLWKMWCPLEGARERSRKDRVPYLDWIDAGYIEGTPGDVIDFDTIKLRVFEAAEQYDILHLAVDRWNSTQLMTQMGAEGIDVVPFGQGTASMNDPTKYLDTLVRSCRFGHGNNPVARWMASNLTVRYDPAGNRKPDKEKSSDKIDGIVAALMGLGLAMQFLDNQSDPELMVL